ncbi:MAG: FmdE family protein [Luteibaculaceae bacterium]
MHRALSTHFHSTKKELLNYSKSACILSWNQKLSETASLFEITQARKFNSIGSLKNFFVLLLPFPIHFAIAWVFTLGFILVTTSASYTQSVYSAGKAQKVMHGLDLSNTIQLDSILIPGQTIAVGPVENLQGEITVFMGKPIVSTLRGNTIETQLNPLVKAPFLAYSQVPKWFSFTHQVSIQNQKDLEKAIDSLAKWVGIDTEQPFPFYIESTFDSLSFHIIMRDTNNATHSHELHKKSKVMFTRYRQAGVLVGLYSKKHEGVFTHKNSYIHVHYLNNAQTETGHLDYITHNGNITLYLPDNRVGLEIQTLDTDFSKGTLNLKQRIHLDDVAKLHGHLCDGLVVGFQALTFATQTLFPDEPVDRTNLRVVSKSSPCVTDAGIYLTGARYQYNTFYVDNKIPFLYMVSRIDNGQTVGVNLKPGIKPAAIDSLGNLAVQQKLSACALTELKSLEDAFTAKLWYTPLTDQYEITPIPNFKWKPRLKRNFVKTDIVNKHIGPCIP